MIWSELSSLELFNGIVIVPWGLRRASSPCRLSGLQLASSLLNRQERRVEGNEGHNEGDSSIVNDSAHSWDIARWIDDGKEKIDSKKRNGETPYHTIGDWLSDDRSHLLSSVPIRWNR